MPEFLELLPPKLALDLFLSHLPSAHLEGEVIPTQDALGRVTVSDIRSPELLPAFARSTVDGYAVRAVDTYGAGESQPGYLVLVGEIPMGASSTISLKLGEAALIHTGGMLPKGADAVIMLEYTQPVDEREIEIIKSVAKGENIIEPGEDVQIGQVVIPAGKQLHSADLGGLSALGITNVIVRRKPRVAVLSSGDEVIPPLQTPQPGQVRDVNSTTLSALISRAGGLPICYDIVPDRQEDLERILVNALADCDAAVITAGSSASTRDYTAAAISKMGEPGVLVHGVNVKPGKPTILAVCNDKPVVGLPGNPVSALVIAWLFVEPLIRHMLGSSSLPVLPSIRARLTANVPSLAGREDYVPVRIKSDDHQLIAEPIFFKSNLIFSLAQSDGLICIPADATGFSAGTDVEVFSI